MSSEQVRSTARGFCGHPHSRPKDRLLGRTRRSLCLGRYLPCVALLRPAQSRNRRCTAYVAQGHGGVCRRVAPTRRSPMRPTSPVSPCQTRRHRLRGIVWRCWRRPSLGPVRRGHRGRRPGRRRPRSGRGHRERRGLERVGGRDERRQGRDLQGDDPGRRWSHLRGPEGRRHAAHGGRVQGLHDGVHAPGLPGRGGRERHHQLPVPRQQVRHRDRRGRVGTGNEAAALEVGVGHGRRHLGLLSHPGSPAAAAVGARS